MSPLLVYRTAAESMTFTYAAIAGWLVAHAVMEARQYPLSGLGAGPAPDLWFGYTPDRLNGYYGEIGEGGCRLYVRLANWDLFPYMFLYSGLLGSVLVRVARRTGRSDAIAHLVSATLLSDMVETAVQREGCRIFPSWRLDDRLVAAGSWGNRIKWILLAASALAIPWMLIDRRSGKKKASKR